MKCEPILYQHWCSLFHRLILCSFYSIYKLFAMLFKLCNHAPNLFLNKIFLQVPVRVEKLIIEFFIY